MNLRDEIKELIIKNLNLEDIRTIDISDDMPLFGEGLGLDSVDALELGLVIQKTYKITLDSKNANIKEIFYNVANLADYIEKNRS